MNREISEKVVEACKKVAGEVECIIAYGRKKTEPRERLKVFSPEEADLISITPLSANNPANLLVQKLGEVEGKVAVVAKGCDSRAIKQLSIEGKIDRSRVYIIGVSCPGVVDYRKFSKAVMDRGLRLSEVGEVWLDGDEIVAGDIRIPFVEVISDNCLLCSHPTPIEYDVLVGERREGRDKTDFSDVEEFERMSKEERWEYWIREFEKCIRCHACRQVCPLCYCTECLVDPVNLAVSPMTPAEEKASYPRILGRTVNASDNLIYHIIRVLHHAGRCAGCGECERACPMELPLRRLERKLEKVVIEEFGYEFGDEVPFLAKLDIVPDEGG